MAEAPQAQRGVGTLVPRPSECRLPASDPLQCISTRIGLVPLIAGYLGQNGSNWWYPRMRQRRLATSRLPRGREFVVEELLKGREYREIEVARLAM